MGNDTVNGNNVTFTGTAEANSTVNVYDGTTDLGTATANTVGPGLMPLLPWASARHSLTATATDAAGNVATASGAIAPAITN